VVRPFGAWITARNVTPPEELVSRMATLETPAQVHRAPLEFRVSKWNRAFLAFDKRPWRVFAGISVFYVAAVFTLAWLRHFWFDELITYYIAKINSLSGIWEALARASDPNPPLTHVLVMWSMRIFGGGEVAARLPAILAAFVGVLSLFLFLRKRVPVVYAATGVFFFMATHAFSYSYESRSYAFMLAFAMLSLVLWRAAIEGRRRHLAAISLALTLAAGLSANYYCVLAFFPIAAGELVRTAERRKVELRVWLALAFGALPLFLYLPLINAAIANFGPYAWNKPTPEFLERAYVITLGEIGWLVLAVFNAAVVIYFYQRAKEGRTAPAVLPRREFVAVLTLILYPVLGYAVAIARAGMISPRLVVPLCYGVAIAFAVAAFRIFGRHAASAFVLLGLCFSWAFARSLVNGNDFRLENAAFERVIRTLPTSGTLLVSDSLLALPLQHYAPKEITSRMLFPFDVAAVRKHKGEDSPEQNLWAGRDHLPLKIVPLETVQKAHASHYYLVGTRDDWLQRKLAEDAVPFRQLPINSASGDLWIFFPLSHGSIFVYEAGEGIIASRSQDLKIRE